MLKSQELQIKLSQLRNALNEGLQEQKDKDGNIIPPDLEKRSQAIKDLQTTESEYQAAVAVEAADTTLHGQGVRTPLSPLLELRSKVRLSEYIKAALQGTHIAGAEAEYNKELRHEVAGDMGGVCIPWEFVAPDTEERADTLSPATTVINRRPAGRFLDRVMAGTHATYMGLTYDSVAVGEPIHTIMTSGTAASMVEPDNQVDAEAANFTLATLTPKRMSARYVWRVEDTVKLAGLEAALQRDLSRVMAEQMDWNIFNGQVSEGAGTTASIVGLFADPNVQTMDIDMYAGTNGADGLEVLKILGELAALVDGYYARTMSDIKLLVAANINQLAISNFTAPTVSTELQKNTFERASLNWAVHEKMGGTLVNGISPDNEVVGIGSRPMHKTGVGIVATWPSIELIRDPYTGAGKGHTALTALTLWDFKVIRANSFFKITTDNS